MLFRSDWDDGTNSGWIGPFESCEIVNASHIWNTKGVYSIKVKAKDVNGAESDWSDPLAVSMPKNKLFGIFAPLFEKLVDCNTLLHFLVYILNVFLK